jgi:hypothetical protein
MGIQSADIPQVFDPTTGDVWRRDGPGEEAAPLGPEGSKLVGRGKGGELTPEELRAALFARYDRAREISRTIAEGHGFPVRYFWQPNRFSRRVIREEPHGDEAQEIAGRQNDILQRRLVPDDVVDLGDVLDDTPGPVYTDDVHHNEVGARVVGQAIYGHIEAQLRALQKEKG